MPLSAGQGAQGRNATQLRHIRFVYPTSLPSRLACLVGVGQALAQPPGHRHRHGVACSTRAQPASSESAPSKKPEATRDSLAATHSRPASRSAGTQAAQAPRPPTHPPTDEVPALAGRRLCVRIAQPGGAVCPHPGRLDGPAGPRVAHSQALRGRQGSAGRQAGQSGRAPGIACMHAAPGAECTSSPLRDSPLRHPLACSRSASSTRSMPDAPSASSSSMRSLEVVKVGTTSSPAGLLRTRGAAPSRSSSGGAGLA